MEQLQSYNDLLEYFHTKERRHYLLLGNGFSAAYDKKIFSYNALNNLVLPSDEKELKPIFNRLKTENFEIVAKQLENYEAISEVLGANKQFVNKIKTSSVG